MPNIIKLRRLKQLVEALRGVDKRAAFDLISIIETIERPPQPARIIEESIQQGMREVAARLKNIDWCLAGALAVIHWVDIRKTYDIDCLIFSEDLSKVRDAFPGGKTSVLGYSVFVSGVNVDFLESSVFPWSKDAMVSSVSGSVAGSTIKIMRPEYLIAFKLRSMRDRDNSDILHMLLLDGVPEKAKAVIRKHEIELLPDLEQMIAMAEVGDV